MSKRPFEKISISCNTRMTKLKDLDISVHIHSMNIHTLALLILEQVCAAAFMMLIAGEQVKIWNKVILPAAFISEIHEFLDRFSLSEQARNPIGRKTMIKKVTLRQNMSLTFRISI